MTQMRLLMNYALQGTYKEDTYKEDVQNDVANQQISMDAMEILNSDPVHLPMEDHFAENSGEHLENPKSVPGATIDISTTMLQGSESYLQWPPHNPGVEVHRLLSQSLLLFLQDIS